jgi:hypothetical protein
LNIPPVGDLVLLAILSECLFVDGLVSHELFKIYWLSLFFLFSERLKEILLQNYKEVIEELETNIIQETLQTFIDIHKHDINDAMQSFLPASGKSRKDRMNDFLTFVFKNDEYVLQLEKVLKRNSLDHLLEVKEEQEEELKATEGN